jgi:hypothetical protein
MEIVEFPYRVSSIIFSALIGLSLFVRRDPRVPDATQQIGLAFVAARDRLTAVAKVEQDGKGVGHAPTMGGRRHAGVSESRI